MRSVALQDLIGDESRRLVERGDALAILPLGSTDGADYDVASEIAQRVAARMGALLLPTLPFGYSPDHQAWPGTIHLTKDALRSVLLDVAMSLARHGVASFVILLGHWGNYEPALEAQPLCAQRGLGMRIEVIRAFDQSALDMAPLSEVFDGEQWYGHGGAAEVSVSLHARRHLQPPSPDHVARTSPPLIDRAYSRLGWEGLPEKASPKQDAKTADIAAEAIIAYLRKRSL